MARRLICAPFTDLRAKRNAIDRSFLPDYRSVGLLGLRRKRLRQWRWNGSQQPRIGQDWVSILDVADDPSAHWAHSAAGSCNSCRATRELFGADCAPTIPNVAAPDADGRRRQERTMLMTHLIAIGALFFLFVAIGLYIWRREPSPTFVVCAVLGIALSIANLLVRLS